LRNDAGDRDICSGQSSHHLALAQTRSVVFEGDLIVGFVMAEAPQAIHVCEFAQIRHLLCRQRRLQFERKFHESHSGIISARANLVAAVDADADLLNPSYRLGPILGSACGAPPSNAVHLVECLAAGR
jgi:hypothetical protein